MEPSNRPYVEPATEPGDAGTEPWADDRAEAEVDPARRPTAAPSAAPQERAAIDGSPADRFLTEDSVNARNEDPDTSEMIDDRS